MDSEFSDNYFTESCQDCLCKFHTVPGKAQHRPGGSFAAAVATAVRFLSRLAAAGRARTEAAAALISVCAPLLASGRGERAARARRSFFRLSMRPFRAGHTFTITPKDPRSQRDLPYELSMRDHAEIVGAAGGVRMPPHVISACAACAGDVRNARVRRQPIGQSRMTSCGAWPIFSFFMLVAKFER